MSEFKKETIEEASEKYSISCGFHKTDYTNPMRISFEVGAKWQSEQINCELSELLEISIEMLDIIRKLNKHCDLGFMHIEVEPLIKKANNLINK